MANTEQQARGKSAAKTSHSVEDRVSLTYVEVVFLMHKAFREGVVYGYIDDQPGPIAEPHAAWEEEGQRQWCVKRFAGLPDEIESMRSDEAGHTGAPS